MFGNQSSVLPGVPFGDANTDVWFQNFEVSMDTSLWGQDFNARLGRVSHKVGPYFFQRPDNTPYFWNDRWDNHEWYFDGAIFNFMFGKSTFTLFGGRQSNRLTTNGIDLNPMAAGQVGPVYDPDETDRPRGFASGAISVDAHLGATLSIPLTDKGKLNLAYLVLDQYGDTFIGNSQFVNRAIVLGGDVNFMFNDRFGAAAGYSQSNLNLDSENVIDEDNSAWWANAWWKGDKWGAKVGYRSIDPQFNAPGDWGRIGIWWNPSDIQGFTVGAHFDLSDKLMVMANGGFYTGRDVETQGILGLTQDDKVNTIKVDLNYNVNENWDLMVGGEFVDWNLEDRTPSVAGSSFTGGKPRERWYNIGLKYHMGENAWWGFLWQISDYNSKNTSGWGPFGGNSPARATGGFITSQIGIKF
jgi:hypothetical protein